MNDKNINSKKETCKKSPPEIVVLIEKKLLFFQDVIQKTILHIQKNKILDIIGVSEVNSCINTLFELIKDSVSPTPVFVIQGTPLAKNSDNLVGQQAILVLVI